MTQVFWLPPAVAGTYYWDADGSAAGNNVNGTGLGGSGVWDTSASNWWDLSTVQAWPNTSADDAIFTGPLGFPSNENQVFLASPVTANQLSFLRSGYVLLGGDLNLEGPNAGVWVNFGETATINSILGGTDGFVKTGGGLLRLGNAGNTYTGVTTISNGTLGIASNGALGADNSAVIVTGSTTRAVPSGALMLQGSYDSGVTLTRNVSLQGAGPAPITGAALVSIGKNSITGLLSNGTGSLSTGVSSVGGHLSLSNVTLSGTTGTAFLTVGVGGALAGVPGVGSYSIDGILLGTGSIQKSGGGTLMMSPATTAGYTGTLRIYSGSMRFESVQAFGNNTGSGSLSTLDLAGDSGLLEVRMDDAPIGKNIYMRAGGSPIIFVDHGIGSNVLNGTATFGTLTYDDGETLTFNGRNGFGVTVGATPVITGNGNSAFTNNLTGTLTFNGDFWSNSENTANRTMTVGGTGNTVINGDIIASAAAFDHILTKTGAGTLTVLGTGSTLDGTVNIQGGTLAITDFRSIGNNTSTINLGSTITAGTLQIGTTSAATVDGLVTSKAFNLIGTSGNGVITASQAGANPVVLNGAFTATGMGSKSLVLNGTNTADNLVNGAIVDNGTVGTTALAVAYTSTATSTITLASVDGIQVGASISGTGIAGGTTITAINPATKVVTLSLATNAAGTANQTMTIAGVTNITSVLKSGPGTWSLAGANTYTGTTLVSNGTLRIQDTFSGLSRNVLTDSAGVGFTADAATVGTAGGTLHYVGAAGSASSETVGTLVGLAGAGTVKVTPGDGGTANLNFASVSSTQALTAGVTAGATLTVGSTAGLYPGMKLTGGSAAATISSIINGTQIVVSANQTLTSGTTVTFERPNGGSTVNFAPDAGGSVTIGTVAAVGLLNSYSYFNGADFAYAPATTNAVLRAPVYGTDAGFVTAGAALTSGSHNLVTGDTTTGAVTALSLKIAGNHTVNQTGLLTVRTGAAGTTGGILVTGGAATISGTGVSTGGAADLIIRVDGAGDVLNLNAPITATTTGGLIKTGAGTLVIGAQNAQTTGGTTHLNEGTIRLAPGGRLSANTVNFTMRQGTVFDLNGVNVSQSATTSSIGIFSGAGTVANTSGAPVIFAIAGSGGVFNGSINETAGQISVVKMGTTAGQTFTGISNYTGSTTIGVPGTGTTGVLTVTNLADIGQPSGIGRGDATDDASNAASLIFGGTTGGLTYTGNASISINRLFTLAGTAAGSGGGIGASGLNNATIIWRNTAPIAFTAGNSTAQTLTLTGTSTGDNQFHPRIIDNPETNAITSVTKTSTGVWELRNASNSYTGATTAGNGVLRIGDGSLPATSPLVLGITTTSGTIETSGEFTRSLAASAVAGAETITWGGTTGGGGFAASTGKLVVALGGIDSPAELKWGTGGFVGTGGTQALVLNSITALNEVEVRNAIDLNGAVRTITVNDNTSTFTDFATITGVLSNSAGTAAGISKTGAGTLQLLGANTYNGTTAVTGGMLIVNSLGNSADPATGTSVGTNIGANLAAQAVTLGNGSTTAGILQYVGSGEISDRVIRLNTSTGNTQLHADGSGPLVLTNVRNDMVSGAKSLYLRGGNTQANMITSNLGNNGSALSIVADQGAVWVLSGSNTYTGNTTVSAGALGAGHDNAFGTGTLLPRNGTLFAHGGDRTIANAVSVASTTTAGTFAFMGEHSLNMTGAWNYTNTTAGHTITNGIAKGENLTLAGNMALNALTGNVTLTINGSGDTVLNSAISTTTAFAVGVNYTGNGTLLLGGTNTTGGTTTINNAAAVVTLANTAALGTGTLSLATGTLQSNGTDRVIANNVTHGGTFTIGGADKFTFNGTWLNNAGSRTLTVNTAGGVELAGQVNLSEHATTARTLTVNGTGDVLISGVISNGVGTGASALAYTGNGTLTLTNGGNSYTGTTTVSNVNGTLRLMGSGKLSTGNLTVTAGTLLIEGVSQSVSLLTMGGTAAAGAEVEIGSGLSLDVTGVTYTGTSSLAAQVNGAGTLALPGSGTTTVTVADNATLEADMVWNVGTLTGGGTFIKTGNGNLDIRGITTNSFSGTFRLDGGSILGLGPLDNNISLNGGVYSGFGTFTRSLGTGNDQIQWEPGTLGGGFAAVGGNLTVTLGGTPDDPLVWGSTTNFVPTGAPLIFGSTAATGVVEFTHNINLGGEARTVTVNDNTAVTTDQALLSGLLNGTGGGLIKNGNGVLQLTGANTFTGPVTVSAGTLQFSTISNNGGGASNLGQGTDGITMGGGRLQFVGDSNQATDRAMTFTTTGILDASGVGGATITFNGPVTPADFSLNLEGSGIGFFNGTFAHTGSTGDLNKNGSGTWTINTPLTIGDNVVISGGTLIFNAVNTFTGPTSDDLFIRTATLKLGVNGALTKDVDDFNISTETASGGTFDINGTTGSSVTDIIIGTNPANQGTAVPFTGSMIDSVGGGSFSSTTLNVRNGTVSANVLTIGATTLGNAISADNGGINTTTGTISGDLTLDAGSSLVLYNGAISGDVSFASGIALTKHSPYTVTLSGNNSVTGAGTTTINNGILRLDHSTNTGGKISDGALVINGGVLEIIGHASTGVTVAVGNVTLGSTADPAPAIFKIDTDGAAATLQMGTITRVAGSTLRFNPDTTDGQFNTSAVNAANTILGGWATYQLGSGAAQFATVSGGAVIGLASTVAEDITSWTAGIDATDGTGFSGTLASNLSINSLRFDAATGASTVTIGADRVLEIASGGILITNSVAAGNPKITGGTITGGAGNELIITHDGTAPFTLESRLSGSVGVTKAGAGTMVLNNIGNTSNGTLRIGGGTLRLEGGGAVGDRAAVIIEAGAGVVLEVADSETIGSLSGGSTTNYRGMEIKITDGQALTINQTATLSYFGHITAASGAATLTKAGPSTLTINDGVINLGAGGVLNIIGSRLTLDINGNNNQITQIASGATVNISNGGSLFIDHNDISTGGIAAGRIADNVAIIMNSGGSTTDSLLYRHNQDGSQTELVGKVTFASGVSSIRVDATSAGTSANAILRASSVARENQATLTLRGANIQKTANPRAQFQVTALLPGFGTGSTINLPVIPWGIGLSAGGTSGAGDSFLTTAGTANAQWRPLDLATEYAIVNSASSWNSVASTNNVLVNASTGGVAGSKSLRSLVIATGSGTVDLTGDGTGPLTVESGGFLFSGTGSSTLSGFTGIRVDPFANEYVFHVMGSSATVTPALISTTAKLTKSGPGTLILTGDNSGLGTVALNEGVLQINDLDGIGGATGQILFAGGTLRLSPTNYSGDDLSTRTFTFLSGGGTLDTAGNDVAFANSIGNGSAGGMTKAGTGTLTLAAPINYLGATVVTGGTLAYGVANALPVTANVTLGGGTLATGGFDVELNGITVTANSALNIGGEFEVTGSLVNSGGNRTLSFSGGGTSTLQDIQLSEAATARTLTLAVNDGLVVLNGSVNLGGAATGTLAKSGAGTLLLDAPVFRATTLTLSGGTTLAARDLSTGTLSVGTATLAATDAARAFNLTTLSVANGATSTFSGDHSLTFNAENILFGNSSSSTAVVTNNLSSGAVLTLNATGVLRANRTDANRTLTFNGSGDTVVNAVIADFTANSRLTSISYTGNGTLTLTAANAHTGATTVNNNNGTLRLSGAGKLGPGAVAVSAGTLELNLSLDDTVSALTMGGGAAGSSANLLIGAGRTLTLGGTVTYSASNNNLAATIDGGLGAILDFGGAGRTFNIGDSTNAEPDMIIAANITIQNDGGGGLTKTGTGTLHIAGTNNLTGPILIQGGAVTGNLGTGNITLNNGVFEGNGTFTRALGTLNNQIQWAANASGGFAASGGDLTVTLSGAPDPLVWDGTPLFVSGTGGLLFGSTTADGVTTFTHNIDLNASANPVTRTITVNDNPDLATDKAVLPGALSQSGGGVASLTKAGAGVLELQGANTFTGTLTVSGGVLQFSSLSNLGGGAMPLNLGGGTLQYLGAGDVALTGAVTSVTTGISNLGAGSLELSGGAVMTGTLTLSGTGPLTLSGTTVNSGGNRTILVTNTGGVSLGNINLSESNTARTLTVNVATGATAEIEGVVGNGGTGASNLTKMGNGHLTLSSANTLTGALIVSQGVVTMTATNTGAGLQLGGGMTGTNSELILDGADFNLNNSAFFLNANNAATGTVSGTGKILLNATRTWEIRPSTSASFAASPVPELVIEVGIDNGIAASGVTKTRNGTMVFAGANGYTGTTSVNEGTLRLDYRANTGSKIGSAAALSMTGGTLELIGHATTPVIQTTGAVTIGLGSNRFLVDATAGADITLDLAGAITSTAAGRSADFVLIGPGATIRASGSGLTVTNGILGGWATFNSSGFATLDGSNDIRGFAASAKDDVATWTLDENVTDSAGYFGTTASLARINSLAFTASADASVTVGNYLNIGSGGIVVAPGIGANATGISGGNLITQGGAFYIHQNNTGEAFTIASSIRGNASITKNGNGTLILDSAANDSSGAVFINRGTLVVRGGNALSDTGVVTMEPATGALLKLEADERIGSISGGGLDGGWVDIGSHTLTLSTGATYSGQIVGNGTLVKMGGTNWNVTAASPSFTGSMVINEGLVQLSGSGIANMTNVTSWLTNPNGALLIDSNSTTGANRIGDAVPLAFNSANGLSGTQVPFRGLWVRANTNNAKAETVGATAFNSGASYAVIESLITSGNSSISEIIMASLTRGNASTLSVRGTNLGAQAAVDTLTRGRMRLGTAGQTAFTTGATSNLIGGNGAAASTTINIVPWMIGQDLGTNLLSITINNERGNSLLTYVNGVGFRPLNFTNEYAGYAAAGATGNVRESLTADLGGLTGKTVNALVLNNASAAAAVTVTGSGALVVTSGAFLFTAVDGASATGAELAAPQGITVGGFDSITVGPAAGAVGNEFIFHTVNSSAAGVTIQSNLVNSTAGNTALTKSGLGTLILTGVNTYSGRTTLNEGILDINSWAAIGGATGSAELVFAGGTLRLATGFAGDFDRGIKLAQAGGVLDTNGASLTLNVGLTDIAGMQGGLTKAGEGTLTLAAAASNTGTNAVTGGTLRLGINQAIGGGNLVVNNGTLDLNGFNANVGAITLANSANSAIIGNGVLTSNNSTFDLQQGQISAILAGSSNLIKTTSSTVTLSGLNTFSGVVEVRAGTLAFDSIANVGVASALGQPTTAAAGTIRVGLVTTAGTLLYTGAGGSSNRAIEMAGTTGGLTVTQNGAVGPLVLAGGISNAGPGNKTITLQGTNTAANEIAGGINEGQNGILSVTKAQAGTWILSGVNNYTGTTTVSAGSLGISGDSAIGSGTLTLGSGTVFAAGGDLVLANLLQQNNNSTAIFSGDHSFAFSNNFALLAAANNVTTTNNIASGKSLTFGAVTANAMTAARSWTINGSGDTFITGGITTSTAFGLNLVYSGTGSLTLSGAYPAVATTSVNNGVLTFAADQTMPGSLQFGSANSITTAGTVDLSAFSATFSGLLAQTNSATEVSQLTIGDGKSLTINGTAIFGSTATNSTTKFSVSGDGAFNVNNATTGSATFLVGNTGSTNVTEVDFSALKTLNVTLGGTMQVSSTTTTNSTGFGSLVLAEDSTIIAAALTVGGGGSYGGNVGQINALRFGTGNTLLNVDAFNIGTGIRDLGSVTFLHPTDGSLTVRNAAGNGKVAFNMGTGSATTGVALNGNQNTFDVTGHSADLLFGAVNIGTQNRNQDLTNVFSFDEGTLAMDSLTMSTKAANGFTTTSTMNLGGGTVTIGTAAATAVTLATNSGPGAAVATLNITGGSVTVTGNIVRGNNTGAGTATGTVNLDGGSLNMSGKTVGSATNIVAFNAQAGSLSGLAELNGGAVFTKTTTGVLSLGNGNTYTGGTAINGGILLASNTTGSATGTGTVTVNATGTLGGAGVITGPVSLAGGSIAPGGYSTGSFEAGDNSLIGQLTVASVSILSGGTLELQLGGVTFSDPDNMYILQNDPGNFSAPASWTNYQAGVTEHDQLLITDPGAPNLDLLTIHVLPTFVNGYSPAFGDVLQVVDWTSLGTQTITGNITWNLPTLSGFSWDTSLFASHGVIAVVPEPSRMLLLFLGLFGLAFRRRRIVKNAK